MAGDVTRCPVTASSGDGLADFHYCVKPVDAHNVHRCRCGKQWTDRGEAIK